MVDKDNGVWQVDLSTVIIKGREDSLTEQEEDEILPSFTAIKRKTHQTLYHDETDEGGISHADKSPKGSVDDRIRPLVDLINHHDCLATLSSCSGRMALFDPNSPATHDESTIDDEDIAATATTNSNITANNSGSASGKGHGRWLMVSHDPIALPPTEWVNSLDEAFRSRLDTKLVTDECDSDHIEDSQISETGNHQLQPISFLFEPMLLHIAACNLSRGQELLQIALQCGFRESGLVVTSHRVTVAIRSAALTMSVPMFFVVDILAAEDDARMTNATTAKFYSSYLHQLIIEGNRRLHRNQDKLNQLYKSIQRNLFVERSLDSIRSSSQRTSICIKLSPLPDLNLWGHAVAALPRECANDSEDSMSRKLTDLWVFGGYGKGPSQILDGENETNKNEKHINSSSQRSNSVYRLEQQRFRPDDNPVWHPYWRLIPNKSSSDSTTMVWYGLNVNNAEFPKCQGVQACVLSFPSSTCGDGDSPSISRLSSLVLLFGGRTSPQNALNQLFIYHPQQQCFAIPTATSIQGRPPSPRWGHTMTPLSPSNSDATYRVLVVGGCDVHGVINDDPIYVLTCEQHLGGSEIAPLRWEMLELTDLPISESPLCRFHHCTVSFPDNPSDESSFRLIVFGGLTETTRNLLEPFGGARPSNDRSFDVWAGKLTLPSSFNGVPPSLVALTPNSMTFATLSRFGASSCLLPLLSDKSAEHQEATFVSNELKSVTEGDDHRTASIAARNDGKMTRPLLVVTGGLLKGTSPSCIKSKNALQAVGIRSCSTGDTCKSEETNDKEDNNVSSIWELPTTIVSLPARHSDDLGEGEFQVPDTDGILMPTCGSLVHHQCVSISEDQFVVLGGGVPLFSFGDTFARLVAFVELHYHMDPEIYLL